MLKNGLTGRSRTVTDRAVTIKKAVFGINRTDFARVRNYAEIIDTFHFLKHASIRYF